MKWCGAVGLGSEAKAYILDGLVKINGEVVLQRGKKVYPGDVSRIQRRDIQGCKRV